MRLKAFFCILLAFLLVLPSTASVAEAKRLKGNKKKICRPLRHGQVHKKEIKRSAKKQKRSKYARKQRKSSRRLARARYRQYSDALTAQCAIIMDADTQEVYLQKNARLPLQPASTIKIVTGFLALQMLNENDPVRVSCYAESAPRQKAYLRRGEVYPARDLIYATLLHSANDASRALAEKMAGSEEDFAKIMTRTASALGATNTVCRTATGLTAPGQKTTAHDLAVMFQRAMQDDKFASILKTRKFEIQGGRYVLNHNKALWQVEGAEGGKTGFTQAAKRTYVGMFKRNNRTVIISFLGSTDLWGDVRRLVRAAFSDQKPVIHATFSGHTSS
ncbi:MAG: serine hydrolase [Pseudomonadota bacterium]